MAERENREEGEIFDENSQEETRDDEEDTNTPPNETSLDTPPDTPAKVASIFGTKVALKPSETWPDLAEEGDPLYGYPPALQSLYRNSIALRTAIQNDPEIREVFKVSYGIDERGLYPDGAPYTDEMKIQLQASCTRIGYKPHYVDWIIQSESAEISQTLPKLILRYKWLAKPRMAVVQSKIIIVDDSDPLVADFLMKSEFVLKCLWKADSGCNCPNEFAKAVVMQEFKMSNFVDLSAIFGFPYKWAQKFLVFTKPEDIGHLPFKMFIKEVLDSFHYLIQTWNETRNTEAAIMRKFQPYYKFNPWRFVESRIFRKMFRGLCEHRLDTNMINYPGRLYMASLECPEFTIYVGAILYKKFPSVLPCFLVNFKRKSSLEENISKDTLEIIISEVNSDILGKTPCSVPQVSLHGLQMINLIYHIDDLMQRKPLPHIPPINDDEADSDTKTQPPCPAVAKKRLRDDKAGSSVSFRRRFSKIAKHYATQSRSSTTTTTILSQNTTASTTDSVSLPISIRLKQLPSDCSGVLVAVSPTSPPREDTEPEIDFGDFLMSVHHDPVNPVDVGPFSNHMNHMLSGSVGEEDDNVFYAQDDSGPHSPSLIDEDSIAVFDDEFDDASLSHCTNTSSLSELAPDSVSVDNIADPGYTGSFSNEFPNNMEVAEQVIVSFDGEVINAVESCVGADPNEDDRHQ